MTSNSLCPLSLAGDSIYAENISILYLYLRKDITPENEGPSG
jgi:hypothetical protein